MERPFKTGVQRLPGGRCLNLNISFVLCLLTSCMAQKPDQTARVTFLAMGGIPVEIIATGVSKPTFDSVTDNVTHQVSEWEKQMSLYQSDSIVNQIVGFPNTPVPVPAETWKTLQYAKEAYTMSQGAFDITIGPLITLWKESARNQVLPSKEAVVYRQEMTGFHRLQLINESVKWTPSNQIPLSDQKFRIDVGGIAKGLFAEWICKGLTENFEKQGVKGLKKIIVNVGGDMYCHTTHATTYCQIGIQDPFENKLWGKIPARNQAVVTSGTYERFFEIQGQRYCHILDPRTGMPIETNLVSVTIIDPSGALADALATTVFVLGETRGYELIKTRADTDMICIRSDGSWTATEAIKKDLTIY